MVSQLIVILNNEAHTDKIQQNIEKNSYWSQESNVGTNTL